MKSFLFALFILAQASFASSIGENELKKMIGQMIVIGFQNQHINKDSKIIQDINRYKILGVILFDRFYQDKNKTKNISSPEQLIHLTNSLQSLSKHHLLISIDQEGGKVARLKPKYGFKKFASAKSIAQSSDEKARSQYKKMSSLLQKHGINCNFAPVVDLEINKKNKVIVGLERSFGISPHKVSKYASILIQEQKAHNIISVLKHFPGHGSSLGDSHLGFVDITNTWNPIELEPYKQLIKNNQIDMIMTAHVFNKHLDPLYPATLSYNVNTKLLREQMAYKGVIISDDLQMKAISKHFSLQRTVSLAINSGVDILLFGNQLAHQDIDELINLIYGEVKTGNIKIKRIIEANQRIKKLYE